VVRHPRGIGRSLLAAAIIAAATGALPGSADAQERERVSTRRTIGQLAAGVAGAWVAGFLAWETLDDPEGGDRRVKGDAGYTPNANTAFAIGSWVGSTLGVWAAGPRRDARTLGFTAIGTGVPSLVLLAGRHEPYLPVLGILFGAPVQAVGGTIAYRFGLRVTL
jgi:hypothetical protein